MDSEEVVCKWCGSHEHKMAPYGPDGEEVKCPFTK